MQHKGYGSRATVFPDVASSLVPARSPEHHLCPPRGNLRLSRCCSRAVDDVTAKVVTHHRSWMASFPPYRPVRQYFA
ncbi:hypothetical protein E2C01_055227 [Portunus trituberculatus]|uniref:Uncharacterized protein n=1 Tax=Portunus trituberculatus TaxID=210409 RepID=A0A5B7GU53_PORTR|nr:hypothetical protein [Portunus trituberculatus]